jgi:hypothetical protein
MGTPPNGVLSIEGGEMGGEREEWECMGSTA